MDDKELIGRIQKKKKLAEFYFSNYKKFVELKKYSKASEFLWGVINCLVTSLSYLDTGKASEKSGFVKNYIIKLTEMYKDQSIYNQFKIAVRMHSNFYQDDFGEQEFKECALEIEKLINNLMSKLIENFEKKIGYPLN